MQGVSLLLIRIGRQFPFHFPFACAFDCPLLSLSRIQSLDPGGTRLTAALGMSKGEGFPIWSWFYTFWALVALESHSPDIKIPIPPILIFHYGILLYGVG